MYKNTEKNKRRQTLFEKFPPRRNKWRQEGMLKRRNVRNGQQL
jgi:hypothetical protein